MRSKERRWLTGAAALTVALGALGGVVMQQRGAASEQRDGAKQKIVAVAQRQEAGSDERKLSPESYDADRLRERGIRVQGRPLRVMEWTDVNGRNLVVLTEREFPGRIDPSATPPLQTDSVVLSVEHYVTADAAARRRHHVQDQVLDCEFDQFTRFKRDSLEVADLDRDGVGEVTVAYTTGCRSDVSADDLHLLVLEDGRRHAVEGLTYEPGRTAEEMGWKSKLAPGSPKPGWSAWPAPFRLHAQARYARYANRG